MMADKHFRVNAEQFKKVVDNIEGGCQADFFIALRIGRSSKCILKSIDGDEITVVNEIDGSSQFFKNTEKLLKSKRSNIGEAIEKGAFYLYSSDVDKFKDVL